MLNVSCPLDGWDFNNSFDFEAGAIYDVFFTNNEVCIKIILIANPM